MIRLLAYAVIFCAGMWVGAKYEEVSAMDSCLDAGGKVNPAGFCEGGGGSG